ncbi:MAG: beta-propeller fold lactonase family protein [Chlamydiota bacterium]
MGNAFKKSSIGAILIAAVFGAAHFFSGARSGDVSPAAMIKGKASALNRPEGIAFSPCGDFFAVANAHANCISFYKKTGNDALFETIPFDVIQGQVAQLDYPHDLSFSPDGTHLAVANRYGDLVTVYKRDADQTRFHHTPVAVIKGEPSLLSAPNAIKYSPVGNAVAVCNMQEHRITFYRYEGDVYEQSPYSVLQNSLDVLNTPDGLAFSRDGELLAVTSHANHSVVLYQKVSDAPILYSPQPIEVLRGGATSFCFTHSLCFHPITDDLIVSSAGGKKNLSYFKKKGEAFPRYSNGPDKVFAIYSPESIHLQLKYPEEGGVKGVAFSPGGEYLGLCASDIAKPYRAIFIYQTNAL